MHKVKKSEITDEQNPKHNEEIGLTLTFFEQTIRGTDIKHCVVQATEEGDAVEVHHSYYFNDWKTMKEAFPDLQEILNDFSESQYWFASWRENRRVTYIKELLGNDGIYDTKDIVFYDYSDPEPKGDPSLKVDEMPEFKNTVKFELGRDTDMEEIGLDLVFFERKLQGTNEVECVVQATEQGREGFEVHEYTFADSWEEMKSAFPTLKELLIDFSCTTNWGSAPEERIIFISSITGHEGLYDVNKTVFYDYEDDSPMVEFSPENKEPKKKMK